MPKRHYRVDPPTDATAEQLRAWNDLNYQLTELTEALSNFRIDTGDTLEFLGDGTHDEDLRVPISAVNVGASKAPGFDVFLGTTYAYHFSPSSGEFVYFVVQLPHSWKEGSSIEPHIHWAPSDATTGTVTWQLEYTWANNNDTFLAPSTIFVRQATKGKSHYMQKAEFPDLDGTGKKISSMIVCTLSRYASDTLDTYAADAALLELDFHYTMDTIGSYHHDHKRKGD